jgi:tetratricopeptide (TPR) repeat protein/uncharacterized protein YegJ (DUF2314 family)
LHGGDLSRDAVHVLESLARHYGANEETVKALGVGYADLGDNRKAMRFLEEALRALPEDEDVHRALMKVLLDEERYEEAEVVSRSLVEMVGHPVHDADLAALALSLAGLGRFDEAQSIMDAHPRMDSQEPLVKRARRELTRGRAAGVISFLKECTPLARWLPRANRTTAGHAGGAEPVDRVSDPSSRRSKPVGAVESGRGARVSEHQAFTLLSKPTVEFWIYAPGGRVPEREAVATELKAMYPDEGTREAVFALLEQYSKGGELTVDYVSRDDAQDLFDYPEELIPHNSRGVGSDDHDALQRAQLIVRVRLVPTSVSDLEYLSFAVAFVEAVRRVTGGVVQDAVSHGLWGKKQWVNTMVSNPLEHLVESHIQFEVLREPGGVWIHTHGMQKFGLPDLELENVPADLAAAGRNMMLLVAETLLEDGRDQADVNATRIIRNTQFMFKLTPVHADGEGHFPVGSLLVYPFVVDYDPHSPATLRHVLKILSERSPRDSGSPATGARAIRRTGTPAGPPARQTNLQARERMRDAHGRARASLAQFKESFLKDANAPDVIHAVKVGFPAQAGEYEWMWVSVDTWRGEELAGQLENAPVLRKDLSKGGRVELSEGQIYDWVITRSGQVVRGAYTEHIERPAMPSNG